MRRAILATVVLFGLGIGLPAAVQATSPTADELAEANRWASIQFEGRSGESSSNTAYAYDAAPFFSFTYHGQPASELLKTWDCKRESRELDKARTEHILTYTDPQTGLVVRCVGIAYHDFPTVEWTLYFKNQGNQDTPILENIKPLDMVFGNLPQQGAYRLHQSLGSCGKQTDYQPLEDALEIGKPHRLSAGSGRTSSGIMPYFNLEMPEKQGLIVVAGWPGLWNATFTRENDRQMRICVYQEICHFKLLPGEEIRTPLVVLQFWKDTPNHAQNVWRRWMMAHSMPKPNGKLPPPQLAASSSRAYDEMAKATEENQIMHIDRYKEEGINLDYWWMDAGWYITTGGWPAVGTWEIDPQRFPKGFKPISDHAHAKGVKIIVWFEPERVTPNTWLTKTHPEWVLGGEKGGLLNLGNSEAWNWLVNHVDKMISEQGIDLYRQDFNMDPLALWKANDAADRQGITEIKHVTGYLAYWDELLRRHPNMLIDTCASGGGRLDLETLRRSVPLWRSDYAYEPIGHQGMTWSLSQWVPYHGTGTVACTNAAYYGAGKTPIESYAFWSNSAPALGLGIDIREKDLDYAALRHLLEQRNQITPYYYGDFYPLMNYNLDKNNWIAWQFNCPESGEGMVQAFRRNECPKESACVPLQGLDPKANYTFTNLADSGKSTHSGEELMTKGLSITASESPAAVVLTYKRTQP